MRRALQCAEGALGQAWPNPAVGAVLVKNNQLIAEAATSRGGRPHAETRAIAIAGAEARGAELYVTLEPCAHTGKTPPCVDAIIAADIQKVFIACEDPDPRTNGKGIAALKNAGIDVSFGMLEEDARYLNRGFFNRIEKNRPYVMLKLATSADGRILLGDGQVRWVTGNASRQLVHHMRAHTDAILTTINTVKADNPLLTCRIQGMEQRSPVRIVLDRRLEIPLQSQLITTAEKTPLWLITEAKQMLYAKHVTLIRRNVAALDEVMQLLAERGITRVMVEAGVWLPNALLEAGLVDEIYWFRSPHRLGKQGVAQPALQHVQQWRRLEQVHLDEDVLEIYHKA